MNTPERGGGAQQEKPKRPTTWDISDKLDLYRRAEEHERGGGEYIIEEIKDYISGGGEDEVREQYYPGWKKEDFEELLNLIEKQKM